MEPLLQIVDLSKSFGALQVLKSINFEVFPGEVVGLAGRSGSGKSVIARLLDGQYPWNDGQICFAGQPIHFPWQSRLLAIEVIHQKPELVEQLNITENIFLGKEVGWALWGNRLLVPNTQRMNREAADILQQLGAQAGFLREKVKNLSAEHRQLISIARAMTGQPRLIVVDDPTALLQYRFQQKLLSLIQEWQQRETAVIFASDNLDHLFAVTDRIVVLREGEIVAQLHTDKTTREEVVSALVGSKSQQRLTPAIWALDSYYQAREQTEKLRHQQMLLERDLVAQDSLNRQLIEELAKQVKALDQVNLALQDAQRRLLTERELERKHLARELHDQIIQDLLTTNYQLEEVESHEVVTPSLKEELTEVRHSIRELVSEVRRICSNLRPPTIDSFGLSAAIQSFARDWSERTGIRLELELSQDFGRLPEALELSIFRIVQEGVNNVRRHAHATAVKVSLRQLSPRALMVAISDNGKGLPQNFDLSALAGQGHYGLLGISERVALLGGRLHLQNQPGGGVLLRVEIPHPRTENPNQL